MDPAKTIRAINRYLFSLNRFVYAAKRHWLTVYLSLSAATFTEVAADLVKPAGTPFLFNACLFWFTAKDYPFTVNRFRFAANPDGYAAAWYTYAVNPDRVTVGLFYEAV